MKHKTFKLRAFNLNHTDIKRNSTDILKFLEDKLEETTAGDRRMLLNEKDTDEDLICNYTVKTGDYVWGSFLRITPTNEVLNIPDELFETKRIDLEQLDSLKDQGEIMYKSHYYFLLSKKHLIVTLPTNITITQFQTYINWFLESERGEVIFEFTPKVTGTPRFPLRSLRSIKISDPMMSDISETTESKSKLGVDLIRKLFYDTPKIEEHLMEDIVKAELTLTVKNFKKNEDYDSALSAYLKPISDTDNIKFYPRNGTPAVTGTDMLDIKPVQVEKLDSGNVNEQQLMQQMEVFLREL